MSQRISGVRSLVLFFLGRETFQAQAQSSDGGPVSPRKNSSSSIVEPSQEFMGT